MGLFGYTAYSPSKFAIKGLAEALQMEVNAVFGFIFISRSSASAPLYFVASLYILLYGIIDL